MSLTLSVANNVLMIEQSTSNVADVVNISLVNSHLQISDDADITVPSGALLGAGWSSATNQVSASGPETGFSSIFIDTGANDDTVKILSNDLPITYQPSGSGEKSLHLGQPSAAVGAQAIHGAITFNATNATSADLDIDDTNDAQYMDPTLTNDSVLNLTPAPVHFTLPPQGTSTTPVMTVFCSGGKGGSGFVLVPDQENPPTTQGIVYQVDSYGTGTFATGEVNAASKVFLFAENGGSELLRLGSFGSVAGVQGDVEVIGNTGTARMIVNDSEDTAAQTFAVNSITGELAAKLVTVTEGGHQVAALGLPAAPGDSLEIDTGTAANTVNLQALPDQFDFTTTVQSGGGGDSISVGTLPLLTALNINGGAGVDHVSVDASQALGAINISNATGTDAVTVDGSGLTTPQTVSLSDAALTGLGSAAFTFANLSSLSVTGSAATDSFTVAPSTTIPITVVGGPDSSPVTDSLALDTTDVTGTDLTFASTGSTSAGTFSFTNRQPVTFSHFASTTPLFSTVTGTIFNQQTGAPLTGATVVVDENNNGIADAGEPTATTDASGAFQIQDLPNGTFGLLTQAGALLTTTPISITVSAGQVTPPVQIPLAPVAAATGPDLIGSIVSLPPVKAVTNKPRVGVKITNLGSVMVNASALQITLFASADTTLDPTDPVLGTLTTVPTLLKTNKGRVFAINGLTSAILPKDDYYLLAAVDTQNAVAETNETNNLAVSSRTVHLAPSAVDLTGSFAHLPATVKHTKPLNLVLQIKNLGTIPATGSILVDLYTSTDNVLDSSDVPLQTSVPVTLHINPAKSQPVRFRISSLPTGTSYLIAKINTSESLAESDLTNNTVSTVTAIHII